MADRMTTPLTQAQEQAVRERLGQLHTSPSFPPPWRSTDKRVLGRYGGTSSIEVVVVETLDPMTADFIANAPSDVQALLGEVARLRGENDTLLDERKAYQAANATFKHQGRDLRDALADRDRLAQRVSELEAALRELSDGVVRHLLSGDSKPLNKGLAAAAKALPATREAR